MDLTQQANYQGSDGAWYTDDGLYIGGGSNATNGTQELVEDESMEKLVNDSSDEAISKLAKELNIKLSDETKDYLYQHYFQEKQNQSAWARTMEADNTRYQRAVEDLKKAGLNPFLAISSLSPSSQTSNSGQVSGGSFTNQLTNKRTTSTEAGTKIVQGIMTMIGVIAAAIIYAL